MDYVCRQPKVTEFEEALAKFQDFE
jgi:hypothetical protein